MVAIRLRRTRVPAPRSRCTVNVDRSLSAHLAQQYLDLVSRKSGQHLSKFLHFRTDSLVVLHMFEKQGLVRFPVKPALPRVNARLPDVTVESPGEKQAGAPPPPHSLDHSLLQQMLKPRRHEVGDRLFSMNEVDDQKVFGAEGCRALPADLLKISKEFRILDLSVERNPDGMLIRAREVGKGLTLADALAIDEVEPLSGPLDKSAFAEHLGDPAVARVLLPEDVVRGDSGWESSGADDLDTAGDPLLL